MPKATPVPAATTAPGPRTGPGAGGAIGLIGYGAVGRELARRIGAGAPAGEAGGQTIIGILTEDTGPGSLPPPALYCPTLDALLARRPDIVVEAASVEALAALGPGILAAGIDLLALSVAAFARGEVEAALLAAARQGPARILLASGAIAGLDAISAARIGGLDEVVLTQRKPPAGLLPPDEARTLTEAVVLADGTAREAALKFPRNANIAACLGLAGIGLDRTRVRVVADPAVRRNTVELSARGAFGEFSLVLANVPSDNPRTSRLTCLSVLAALARRAAPLVLPA